MAEGEELPPVVAVVEGDDASLLEMFDRDIAAARAFGADLQAALSEGVGGLTVSGSSINSEGVAAAGTAIGEELASGIEEGVSGVESAFGDVSDAIAGDLARAGAEGGAQLAAELDAATATVGDVIAGRIQEEIDASLPVAAQQLTEALAELEASGLAQLPATSRTGSGILDSLKGELVRIDWSAEGALAGSAFTDSLTPEIEAAIREMNGPIVESMAETGAESGAAFASAAEEELAAWRESVAAATAMGASVPGSVGDVFAQFDSGAIGASEAVAQLEASMSAAGSVAEISGAQFNAAAAALRTVGNSDTTISQLKGVSVSFAEAQAAAERYGTSEAQLALASRGLQEAQAALADANTALMQSYLVMAESGQADLSGLKIALDGVTSAQATATAMAQAQVDALSAVNLAVIENTTEIANDEAAFASFAATAQMTGVELADLVASVEEGDYALLNMAASAAQAQLQAGALDQAERELAAANLTLVDTYQQVASGAQVSAEQQIAAMQAVTAAKAQVDSLSAAGAGVSAPGLDYNPSALSAEQHAAQLARENAAAMGEVGAAAAGADAAVGGVASTMGGPLTMAMWGAISILPMVGYMFGNNASAAQQQAQALGQLDQAISQDSNMIGTNTIATIANQLATSGAADTLQGYGISLTDATAAMAGVKSAQTDVNGTLQNQIDNLQALISEQEAHATSSNAEIDAEKQQLQQLQATQQGMRDLESDVVNAVAHQNELAQATLNAEQAAGVFAVQVKAADLALQQQAQTATVNAQALIAYDMTLIPGSQAYTDAVHNQQIALANNAITAQINATALNNSLAPQAQLSAAALQAAVNYQQAGTATSQYTAALNGLYGQYGQTSGALATATTAVDNLTGKITSGKDAVNLYTDAGSKNFTQFQQAAQAAETYAEKVYQQTGDTAQATGALQDFAGKLDTAATKAKLTQTQVQQLNTELFGVPNVKDITIHLDPTPAEQAMSALDSFIQGEISSINNTAITPVVGGRPGQPRAAGGPVAAGELYVVGEEGKPEYFVPGADGYITPMDMLTPAMAAPTPAGAGGGYGSSGPPIVNVYVTLDSQEITAASRVEVQGYARHNALTGFVGVGS